MKATGIITEHNPFHNGHKHHINESRKKTNADVIISVMSGNFLQRGEPSFVDKWTRTKMALQGGADLVIELPYVYATAQASDFAKGAITLLDALFCDAFCFGSEVGDIQPFLRTHHLLSQEAKRYNNYIKEEIATGISYPKALNMAYERLTDGQTGPFADLSRPNNILGYHYVESAKQINSSMIPQTIQRIQAGYHDDINDQLTIASATGIRKSFFEKGDLSDVRQFLPKNSVQELITFNEKYDFASWESFWPLLRFTILRYSPEELRKFSEVTEGIEYLIHRAAKTANSYLDFMEKVKSKRFTWTRIQRMLTHIYTNFTWEELRSFESPTYIRLLGMNATGKEYLNSVKKELKLPLISRVASSQDPMLQIDIRATDVYFSGLLNGAERIGSEYRTPPIVI
ncbi:nucleotidyltransferase [Chungangia koreensis]|uniref:tRNA(Met) cytidine acetate ligase n=1 Tax=Chungangia koreensis TaxID=752657 RepID=A0ABV8X1G5_9LACT